MDKLYLAMMWAGMSGLMCLIAVPLIKSKVPRNYVYGFRTEKTLKSDRVWYEANRFAGRAMFMAGLYSVVGVVASAVAMPFMSTGSYAMLGLAIVGVPIAVAVVKSFRYLARL
jgi:uncharacterized membrane protein